MKKLSMLLVAVLALAMMMGFVGCKQEDDVPSGPATVATWAAEEAGAGLELTAYGDNTWKLVVEAMDYSKGTYTGDATKDGTLKCKMTHEADSTGALKEISPVAFDCTISDSGKTLKVPFALFYDGAPGTIDFTRK